MEPTVHIGIVTYNSSIDLPRCFAGIRAQTYPHLRVTVFDNASSDESVTWVRVNVPEATLIAHGENLGFGRAHNRIAATLREGEYYMALNPDVSMLPDYIASVVRELLKAPEIGWAAGKLLLPESKRLYSAGHALLKDGYAYNIGYGLPDTGVDQTREVFGAPGAAVIVKDTLLQSVRPLFDETFFMYSEDVDFDWRARLNGWKCLYVADAVGYHRGSSPQERLRVEVIINRYLSVLKNAFWRDLLLYNLPRIVAHIFLRLMTTPKLGIRMAMRFCRFAPHMIRQRQKPKLSYQEMAAWFEWAKHEDTGQKSTLKERLIVYLQRRKQAALGQ